MRITTRADITATPCRPASAGRLSRLIRLLGVALQVRRERRMLARMDDRALSDIGFDRATAHGEAARALWDIPPERLCR